MYVIRPLTCKEYDDLLDAEKKGDSGRYMLSYIITSTILYPTVLEENLTEEDFNFLLNVVKNKSGFESVDFLTNTTIEERLGYDENEPGYLMRYYRALLLTQGNLSIEVVDSMSFKQMIDYIVAAEQTTKNQMINIPGYDIRGKRVKEQKRGPRMV
jgi:hypothetical protein